MWKVLTSDWCVFYTGGKELVDELLKDPALQKQKNAVEALEEMRVFLNYCELYGIADKVCIVLIYFL
jgi:hypothetical protein